MATSTRKKAETPTREEIARRAYEIYQSEGCPDCRELEHWLQAESQLREEASSTPRVRKGVAKATPKKASAKSATGKTAAKSTTGTRARKSGGGSRSGEGAKVTLKAAAPRQRKARA